MKGLFKKYIITKTNGRIIDSNADYFVLRLDTDKFARSAMRFYAMAIQQDNPILSKEILEKCNQYDKGETNQKINQLESIQETKPITLPILMYEIQLGDFKVVCEDCHANGKVNDECEKCNGDGTYFEEKWIVSDNLVKIIKIDRCKTNGYLRYYDRIDSAYDESELYLHFTKEDAKLECERRNRKLNKKGGC